MAFELATPAPQPIYRVDWRRGPVKGRSYRYTELEAMDLRMELEKSGWETRLVIERGE